jgi:methyl-accepting chemotaxis protein
VKKRSVWLLLCIAFYLLGVCSYSGYNYRRENAKELAAIDQRLYAAAHAAVDILRPGYHDGIWEKSVDDAAFRRDVLALSHMAEKAGLTYVYTMVEKDGKIFFTSTSATAEEIAENDFSAFMSPYDDASDGLKKAFAARSMGYEVATDQWGTFRSVYIPVTSPDGTFYMVGADLSIVHLDAVARRSLIASVLTGLLFIVLILPLVLVLRRFSAQDKRELEERITTATTEILTLNSDLEKHMHEIEREAERAKAAMADAEQAREEAIRARRQGMSEAAEKLREIVGALTTASDALSAQIGESSRGSEQQAARMGETAAAMEEMNATVLEVARNATHAANTAETSKSQAQEGSNLVRRVADEISDAERQTIALREEMHSLGIQAEGIGRVMNVISDIADQTNLLALNAAIEAARAGDAGRGFAVVADEVRKLAEKTMTATKEVGEAISGIQAMAKRTVDSVGQTARTIDATAVLAKESGQGLLEIVGLADKTAEQIQAIATASEQQSATSDEITRNIESVNAIAMETSHAMREASQAVTELARQTQVVRTLIADMQSENHA